MTRRALGLDVGGTKVAGLVLDEDGRVLGRVERPTPAESAEGAIATVVGVGKELLAGHGEVVGAGVGAAGLIETATGIFHYAPNLPWLETPLAERLSSELGIPVVIENDATAAAWGEFRYGAGIGYRDVLVVTVGTGIGGGIVSGGRLLRGAHGFAAEIGHIIVEPGGPRCGCGNLGCWEQVASGNAIGRLGREAAQLHPDSRVATLAGTPDAVNGLHVAKAAIAGDHIALHILDEVGARLGQGIAGLANVLDPEIVVVGGGVAALGDLILEPARRAFLDALEAPEHRPDVPVVAAKLGNDAGAIGAAALVFDEATG